MGNMESDHLKSVDELQKDYDKKLEAQATEYLKLEQEKLEMKKAYDRKLNMLQDENKSAIDKLL